MINRFLTAALAAMPLMALAAEVTSPDGRIMVMDPCVAFYDIFSVGYSGEPSGYEFGGVAVLKSDFR